MSFTLLDWSAIVGYLAITLILGLWFRGRSGKSVDDYFVSGRNVNWWLAGTSMVATTFAADTPLVVTGLVYAQGISGNWLWWGFLFSGHDDRLPLRAPVAALADCSPTCSSPRSATPASPQRFCAAFAPSISAC